MNITTKTKPAMHLKPGENLVLRNQTSGKAKTFSVLAVNEDAERVHPVRVTVAVPAPREDDPDAVTTSIIGFTVRENVEVAA